MNIRVFFSAVLVAATLAFSTGCGRSAAALGDLGAAPAWKLAKLDGTAISSADLKGKAVVLDFWATWCPPCVKEIPGYVALQKKYEQAGLVIVGASMDQAGPDVVKAFVEKNKINYPIGLSAFEVAEAFGGVESIPTTFLIDREGKIRYKKVGYMAEESMEKLIAELVK